MSGINGLNNNTVKLLQQLPKSGKKAAVSTTGQLDSFFQISTKTTSAAAINNAFGVSADSYIFKPGPGLANIPGNRVPLPKFTGLTKAEPQMSEAELRDAIISMAQKDKASGIQYMSNGPDITRLIEKYTCSVSPDRQEIIERGAKGMMIPGDSDNAVMAQVIDEKTGKEIACFAPNTGWQVYRTEEELAASAPFYDLYYKTFFGRDSPTATRSTSPTDGGSTNDSDKTSVDFRA